MGTVRSLIAAANLVVLSAPAIAQPLVRGDLIRISAPEFSLQQQRGRVIWLDRDSLILKEGSHDWVVPRKLLTNLEAARGSRDHMTAGLLVGTAAGLFAGANFWAYARDCGSELGDLCRGWYRGLGISAVLFGAGAGVVLGRFVLRTPRWVKLDLESIQFEPTQPIPPR